MFNKNETPTAEAMLMNGINKEALFAAYPGPLESDAAIGERKIKKISSKDDFAGR